MNAIVNTPVNEERQAHIDSLMRGAIDLKVSLVQGRQAVGPVLLRVLGVADADQGDLQQAHGGRQHLLLHRSPQPQIMLHLGAQPGQGA